MRQLHNPIETQTRSRAHDRETESIMNEKQKLFYEYIVNKMTISYCNKIEKVIHLHTTFLIRFGNVLNLACVTGLSLARPAIAQKMPWQIDSPSLKVLNMRSIVSIA